MSWVKYVATPTATSDGGMGLILVRNSGGSPRCSRDIILL
jgi:hypothetical protein